MWRVTHRANGEDKCVRDERPAAADAGRDGRGGERAEEGAGLEDGDDVGRDRVRLFLVRRAVGLEHVEVRLEEGLGDDAAGDAGVVPEEDDAPVGDEREPWRGGDDA
jgi:hypothetical protein